MSTTTTVASCGCCTVTTVETPRRSSFRGQPRVPRASRWAYRVDGPRPGDIDVSQFRYGSPETAEAAGVTAALGWHEFQTEEEARQAASDNWFEGRTRCPDCHHFCADHAACSTSAGAGGAVVECSCSNDVHFTG